MVFNGSVEVVFVTLCNISRKFCSVFFLIYIYLNNNGLGFLNSSPFVLEFQDLHRKLL